MFIRLYTHIIWPGYLYIYLHIHTYIVYHGSQPQEPMENGHPIWSRCGGPELEPMTLYTLWGLDNILMQLLVGGLEHGFYFPFHIWDVILPIDLKPPIRLAICADEVVLHVHALVFAACCILAWPCIVFYFERMPMPMNYKVEMHLYRCWSIWRHVPSVTACVVHLQWVLYVNACWPMCNAREAICVVAFYCMWKCLLVHIDKCYNSAGECTCTV